ncbi:MAG: hypothetical protein HYX77_00915 [Acidobacteria bacterium]|nr:hypothetical protein [Acidobacteriota bacterium]
MTLWLVACVAMFLVGALPAYAQTAEPRRVGRVEVDAGGGKLGGADLGSADANLRASDPARRSFRLFSTESRFASAPTFHVRAGFAFNRRIGVEGGLMVSRPDIRTPVSADVEDAPAITVTGRVGQYAIDAGVVVMISELRLGSRTVPFVAAGAGYLRQLHEGQTLVEQGHVYHAGGGVKHWLLTRDRGFISAAGLRADARLYLMSGGIAFEDRARPHAAISGSVFVAF